MDGTEFDELTKNGDLLKRLFRRDVFRAIAGGALGTGLGFLGLADAEAKKRKKKSKKKKCKGNKKKCGKRCIPKSKCCKPCGTCTTCQNGRCVAQADGTPCGDGKQCSGGVCTSPPPPPPPQCQSVDETCSASDACCEGACCYVPAGPTDDNPEICLSVSEFTCCTEQQGGGTCSAPGGEDARPTCCPPNDVHPGGICAVENATCCNAAQGSGACPSTRSVCCLVTEAHPNGACCPPGQACCGEGGACGAGLICDELGCCVPEEELTVSRRAVARDGKQGTFKERGR